jgi:histidine-containing phosphotransfer protein
MAAASQLEAAVRQMLAEGVLDDQFQQLVCLQDEANPDFVAEVVTLYFDDSGAKIDKIAQLVSAPQPDFHEVDQIVHQFKGASASLGACAIAQLCIKLRECCQTRDAGTSQQLVVQVKAAYEALRSRLTAYLQLEAQHRAAQQPGGG